MENIKNTLRRITILRKIYSMLRTAVWEFPLKIVPKHSVCAEIGVWKGDFSNKILHLIKPKRLHLIDPWHYEEGDVYKEAWYGAGIGSQENINKIYENVKTRFGKEIESGIISVHRKTSEEACHDFPDDYFDWIYIDGNHQYEFVKKDLENYYKKVKKGGFIAGDDYVEGHWWKDGVIKAVDEIITAGLVRKVKIANNRFILRKE